MTMLSRLSGLVGAAALVAAALGASAGPSDARDGLRFRCHAKAAGQVGFHSRYEERARPRGLRQKFNAEFEARVGGAFVAGQQITFVVDSVAVATVALTLAPSGDVVAGVEFDTNANARNGKVPFPANFPPVQAGTVVEAATGGNTVLGCELQ